MRKKIYAQFFKYAIVGILNTIIGFGSIFIFYNIFNFSYILSNIFGYILGLSNSFVWNKKWTFKSDKHYKKEILPFLIIFVISYFANLAAVILGVEIFAINPNISQILGGIIYTVINFLLNRRWTFSFAN